MRYLTMSVLMILSAFGKSYAQQESKPATSTVQANPLSPRKAAKAEMEAKGVLFFKEFAVGGVIHTNGFNICFTYGLLDKYYLTRLFQIDIAELKHNKENRISKDYISYTLDAPKPYVYGKQNNFYTIRFGYGEKRYFSEKAKKHGLAVGINYMGGLSLGILKPYYLDLYYRITVQPQYEIRSETYTEENASVFLNDQRILGGSGIGYGWDGLKPLPGGFVKFGLLFDWGAFDEFLKTLELGIVADVYYKKVPIMISEQNHPFFVNLYANFHFGKRW